MNSQPEVEPESQAEPVDEPQLDAGSSRSPSTAELEKYKDAALRARAELDNYRKRVAREKEDAIRYANNSLLESLLPILDNFDLGLEAAKNAPEAAGIIQGLGNGAQATGGFSSRPRRRDCECGWGTGLIQTFTKPWLMSRVPTSLMAQWSGSFAKVSN